MQVKIKEESYSLSMYFAYSKCIFLQGLEQNNPRPIWRYIKAKKQDAVGIAPFKKGVHLNSDSLAKAEILDRFHIELGVPQGTVLGLLLFLLYINDLPRIFNSHVRLFANDCLLYYPIHRKPGHYDLQNDLNSICDWAKIWGMSFNTSKCHIMSISNRRVTYQSSCTPC